jgi:hypothetical protein
MNDLRIPAPDCKAGMAYAAHQALLMAEHAAPELADNPYWTMLRQDAYERFTLAILG